MPPKILALGEMPVGASPATYFAAGPWCFAGRENLFPDWEKVFTFAPEPLADADLLPQASKAAKTLCMSVVPQLAEYLAPASHLPPVYWQTLLMPWAIDVAKQIIERSLRVNAMIRQWGKEKIECPILPTDIDFKFVDEHDFTLRGSLGTIFNHWLFSRILESHWPAEWVKTVLPAPPATNAAPGRVTIGSKLRILARNYALYLPFPKLKGMSFSQAVSFSKSLLHPCHGPDHSADLDKIYGDRSILADLLLPADVLSIFLTSLPTSIKKLMHPQNIAAANHPKLKVASISSYEQSGYRQRLAIWRGAGNRLAYVQHGGNYGQVKVVCDVEMVEYSQDIFFTWGWRTHGEAKGNFMPMPSTLLQTVSQGRLPQPGAKMIFVGTEMAAYGYRLDSNPTPLQFVNYRQAKADFFQGLSAEIRGKFLYRPYFTLPGTLTDAGWLLPKFPELGQCVGPLAPQMLACPLLVLDHHGTTMLEAMAANIPLVLYWNRKAWPLTNEADNLLNKLASAGIWHPSPVEASKKVMEICHDPQKWWNCPEIQTTRKEFCLFQARHYEGNFNKCWKSVLEKL